MNLFVFRHSPYGGPQAKEGIDALLAAAAFDQPIALLFLGDGVYQLQPDQQPKGQKNHGKMLKALEMYDVDKVYADERSIQLRNLKSLCIDAQILGADEVQSLIASAKTVLSF